MAKDDAPAPPAPSTLRRGAPPPRYGRRMWRSNGFRLGAIVLGFSLVVGLVLGGSAGLMPGKWDRWLVNFRPASSTGSGPAAKTDSGPKPEKLDYYGDGRAELGDYNVRMFDPLTRVSLRAEFKLEGDTDCNNNAGFQDFIRHNRHFLREQVNVTLRACDPEQLIDTDVETLERRVATRLNRALGRDFLESVTIKDFALYQSIGKSGFVQVDPQDGSAAPSGNRPEHSGR